MPTYHVEAIDTCREKLDGAQGKFAASGDGLQPPGAGVFGDLACSGGISSAVENLCTTARTELGKGDERAGQIAAALDTISVAVQNDEETNAAMMKLDTRSA